MPGQGNFLPGVRSEGIRAMMDSGCFSCLLATGAVLLGFMYLVIAAFHAFKAAFLKDKPDQDTVDTLNRHQDWLKEDAERAIQDLHRKARP